MTLFLKINEKHKTLRIKYILYSKQLKKGKKIVVCIEHSMLSVQMVQILIYLPHKNKDLT